MTNEEILIAAMRQSAIDLGCRAEDFTRAEHVIVPSRVSPDARRYLKLPFLCGLVSYGSNVVASVDAAYEAPVRAYLHAYPLANLMETPHLHALDDAVAPLGGRVCFMAEYFLPDVTVLTPRSCAYATRWLGPDDFAALYLPQWSNALCEKRRELDEFGLGAYDGDTLVGFAACSADCEGMRQIGIDVLPAYRRQGIAAALTSQLAVEILRRGLIPFYCAAWCNLGSVKNALRAGFRPAWVETSVRPSAEVEEMNR